MTGSSSVSLIHMALQSLSPNTSFFTHCCKHLLFQKIIFAPHD